MSGAGEDADFVAWLQSMVDLQKEYAAELETLGWGPTWTPSGDQKKDSRVHSAASFVASVNKLFDALTGGEDLSAIRLASEAGLYLGRLNPGVSIEAAQSSLIGWMKPDAKRGRTVKKGAAAGGKTRLKGPGAEELAGEVFELQRLEPEMSDSIACQTVGQAHGISRRTVENKTRELRKERKAARPEK